MRGYIVANLDGNRTRLIYSDATAVTYTFDKASRLSGLTEWASRATGYTSVTSPGPSTVGYRYDLDGNRTRVIYPDTTAVTYTFDKASRLSGLTDWANRATGYTYVPDGHVQTVANPNGTSAIYSYDNAQRLTQVLNQDSGATVIDEHTYTLDSVGTCIHVHETLAQLSGPPPLVRDIDHRHDHLYGHAEPHIW